MMTIHQLRRTFFLLLVIAFCGGGYLGYRNLPAIEAETSRSVTEGVDPTAPTDLVVPSGGRPCTCVPAHPALFPGNTEARSAREAKRVSDQRLLNFVYENLSYPSTLRESSVTGICVVQIRVGPEGRTTGVQIIRELHPDIDAAVVAAARNLDHQDIRWKPARDVTGNPVCSTLNIPLRFRLE